MSDTNVIYFIGDAAVVKRLRLWFQEHDIEIEAKSAPVRMKAAGVLATVVHANSTLLYSLFEESAQFLEYPIIVIDDEYNAKNCIRVLEAGADDYMVKPIHARELLTRIKAILKRMQQRTHAAQKEVYSFYGWRLYPRSRLLINSEGSEIALSNSEFDMLSEFVQSPQKVLSRDHLLYITKKKEMSPFDRCIDVQISRLRQKIESNPKVPSVIKTVRNKGYMLSVDVSHRFEME